MKDLIYEVQQRPIPQKRPRVYHKNGRVWAVDPSKRQKDDFVKQIHPRPEKLIDGPIAVKMIFEYKDKTAGYCPKYADLDNLIKFVLDALTGIVWVDDKQIVKLEAERKFWEKDRIYMRIKVIE